MSQINEVLTDKIGRAMRAAGPMGDDWNTRFRQALKEEGLELIELESEDWRRAPCAMGNRPDAWPVGTLIRVKP